EHARIDHGAPDQAAALQRPGELAGGGKHPRAGQAERRPGGRRVRDLPPTPDVPAVAAPSAQGDRRGPVGAMTATAPAVRLVDAAVRFGERTLWESLDLTVAGGEFLAVLGPNGAGKSTLLRVLLGLERLSAGSAEVLG